MIKKILIFALCLSVFFGRSAYAESLDCQTLENKTVYFSGEAYLPVREVLSLCGFDVSWDKSRFAYVAEKEGCLAVVPVQSDAVYLNERKIGLKNPVSFRNNVLYMPLSAAKEICAGWDFEIPVKNINLFIGDDFRFQSAEKYKDRYVCEGGFIFKPYYISQSGAAEYADTVRQIAEALPDVRVFCMLVPEASEIYAPKNLKCGQAEAFAAVCGMLPETVTAVDACSALYEKAGEKIYFNTDHHWTQRGAYYAYKAFLNVAGGEIDDIATFESKDFYSYKGSYANEGFDVGAPEIMERFMPKYGNEGFVYAGSDAYGEKTKIDIVNPNDDTYACFIGGDNALTELCGNENADKTICIAKESFGNAFATWAVNNYKTVYVVDIRKFGGTLVQLHNQTGFDDLLIESYAESVGSRDLRAALKRIK